MTGLKEKIIRGGVAKVVAQGTTFCLRLGSLMILARLLDPKDFGLVGMVTAFTGVLNLFRDFGLSAAAVQRVEVTEEQVSTLFWINIAVGAILTLLVVAMAPFIAAFYHEPRLFWVTVVLASVFLINAAGVQHSAMLQRQMRFTMMAGIDVLALAISVSIGITLALKGFRYWALVATAMVPTIVTTTCLWIASSWVPGRPQRNTGMRSMLRFGGTLTLNGLVVYAAYNLDKVLLGRWWGAQAVGLYGRAYQLITIPTENLNTAAGEVAFPALSRVQGDSARLKRYFLKGYSLVLALTVPITIVCALFANDLISVVLGAKWHDAIPIFRLLSPTILILALINPLIWLVLSLGMVGRSLRIGLVYAPIVVLGCVAGLPYGPTGVALGYSAVLTVWFIPHIAWAVHGTVVSLKDILHTASRPLLSGLTGAVIASSLQFFYKDHISALPRLLIGGTVLLGVYLVMLLYVMGQKEFYLDLIRGMQGGSAGKDGFSNSVDSSGAITEIRPLRSLDRSSDEHESKTDVLFIASDYKPNPGGIAAYLDSLARGLINEGHKVGVLALVEPGQEEKLAFLENYEDWVTPFEIAYDRRPKNWFGYNCASILEIVRCKSVASRKLLNKTFFFRSSAESIDRLDGVLRELSPEMIVLGHLDLKFYPFVLQLQEQGRPYGILAHDSEIYRFEKVNDRVRRGMMIRGAKWIAANSRHTKSLVEAWGIPQDKVVIVHPPLSEEAIMTTPDPTMAPPNGTYRLITVSRIVPNKGIDVVLRALAILEAQNVPFHYVIAGSGPERESLEALASQLGLSDRVEFAGFVAEEKKWPLLYAADLFVMTSRVNPMEQHEGFGIAFLEAAACGIPSIGSNAGGIPDAVIDGETGILVEPDSAAKLAEALLYFYQNPEKRREMGRRARTRARTQFSPKSIASQFEQKVSLRIPKRLQMDAVVPAGVFDAEPHHRRSYGHGDASGGDIPLTTKAPGNH